MPDTPAERGDEKPATTNPSGVTGRNIPAVRQGARPSVEAQVVALYQGAGAIIREDLGRAIRQLGEDPERRSAKYLRNRSSVLLRDLQRRIGRIDSAAARLVTPEVERAYRGGLSQAGKQATDLGLGESLPDGFGASFTGVDSRAVELIAQDTISRMSDATMGQAARAAQVFRTLGSSSVVAGEPAVNRAIANGLITGDPRIAEREVRKLFDATPGVAKGYRQLGNQIITVGGWEGPLRAYASTVVRTRTREATVTARHGRLAEAGIDLVQITGRVSANFCTRFLGLVVALGDARDGYPSINDLPGGAPPFHPNCSKGTAAYVPELVSSGRARDHDRALVAFRRAAQSGSLKTPLKS